MLFKRLLILVVVVTGVVTLVLMVQPKNQLPGKCKLLLSADGPTDATFYWWLSNRAMLVYRYDASITSKTPARFFLHDYVSGIDTLQPVLTREFNAAGAEAFEAVLSDDNAGLVWKGHRWPLEHVDRTPPLQHVYRIDGNPLGGETCNEELSAIPAGSTTSKTFPFAMPRIGEVLDVAFNRQGDRVAWVEACGGRMITIAGRWVPLCDEEVQLWISNIDGSNRHEVGYGTYPIAMACDHGTSFGAEPSGIHWLPDGRRLSFECKGNVYLAPGE